MSLFKSKKTYIKRYASKNLDKKITFAPSVKTTFSAPVAQIKPTVKAEKPTKEPNRPQGPNGTIRFAHDSEYKNSFTEVKPEYTKAAVVSGPAVRRPDPIEKPDLTGVKAEGKVRPVIDGDIVLSDIKGKIEVSEEIAEIPAPAQNEPQSTPNENTQSKQQPIKTKKDVAKLQTNPEPDQTKFEKRQKPKPAPTPNGQKPKKQRPKITAGDVIAVVAKTALLFVIICAIGLLGYKYAAKYRAQLASLNAALSTQYPAEDYIYPEVPEDILAKNAQARKEAERIAAQNAYMPSNYEIPNLYKYDYVKSCYLTFDDGPSAEVTGKVLDILKQYGIKATFFVVGQNVEAHPDLIKRMEAEGHSIGNHSYSHNYDYLYSDDYAFDSELNACKNAINTVLGKDYANKIFRFPGGVFGQPASWYTYNINSQGYQYINWNSLTGDSAGEVENPDSEYLMNQLKESTNNGKTEDIVVLMHDAAAKQVTADTLVQVIEYLKSKNYIFKPIYNSNFSEQ